jgi:hypothetical protein
MTDRRDGCYYPLAFGLQILNAPIMLGGLPLRLLALPELVDKIFDYIGGQNGALELRKEDVFKCRVPHCDSVGTCLTIPIFQCCGHPYLAPFPPPETHRGLAPGNWTAVRGQAPHYGDAFHCQNR